MPTNGSVPVLPSASSFRTAVLCGAALTFAVTRVNAQSARYVRLALGSAQLEAPSREFSLSSVRYPAIALGMTWTRGHSAELHVSRLDAETTLPRAPLDEAPTTFGIRATTIALDYYYQPFFVARRVRPRLGVGLALIPVVDRWSSDTPTESVSSTLYGASASVGVAARLLSAASGTALLAYHVTTDGGESRGRRIGLTGFRLEAGVELGF